MQADGRKTKYHFLYTSGPSEEPAAKTHPYPFYPTSSGLSVCLPACMSVYLSRGVRSVPVTLRLVCLLQNVSMSLYLLVCVSPYLSVCLNVSVCLLPTWRTCP